MKKQQEKPKNNVILGLGIDVCDGDAQHFGATLFQRGEYVMHELEQLRQRHPGDIQFLLIILGEEAAEEAEEQAEG